MAQNQNAVVINMGEPAQQPANNTPSAQEKKKQDTLFGPNIGIVASGPDWTERQEKQSDELTPDVVKNWIAKSKETNHSTTTLQALVNLKRPTLRLCPLEIAPSDDPDHFDSQHHHGLEFEYDCDSAKCGIYVHVVLAPTHYLADKSNSGQHTKQLVFEAVTEGGFGKVLKLDAGATLELGRYEHRPSTLSPAGESPSLSVATSSDQAPPAPDSSIAQRPKKRLTFPFRKRIEDRSVTGPALAVMDAETNSTPAPSADSEKVKGEDGDAHNGVKVSIRLVALDEDGKALTSPNEQTTYLHIVRFGAPAAPVEGATEEEDKRPWVVKVVKREATIGPHTFHLHEIYGLSANSTTATQHVTAPIAAPPTTYPPTIAPQPIAPAHEDEPSSECLLCLSSPREVVLLPCRHLVACRECAINMIEFGAGGTITHSDADNAVPTATENTPSADVTTPTGEADATDANAGAEASASPPQPPSIPTTAPPTPRRKRKAKGWFCPVCRQPYTSLLRITTTPLSKDITDEDHRDSTDTIEHPLASNNTPQITSAPTPTIPAANPSGRNNILSRPAGFLRSLGRQQPEPDVERAVTASA